MIARMRIVIDFVADARTAFLYDSDSESIVGLLSITDFIHVLLRLRRDRDALAAHAEDDRNQCISEEQLDIAQLSIAEWRRAFCTRLYWRGGD